MDYIVIGKYDIFKKRSFFMLRVLHVLEGLHAGGMQSMIMNYFRSIDRKKIQFDFLLFSDKSFFDNEVLEMGGKIFRLTARRKNFIKNRIELDEFFRKHTEYKIVHIHQGINYFIPLEKAKKYKTKVRIVHSHGMDPKLIKKQGIFYKIYTQKKIENLATDYLACSHTAAMQMFTSKIIDGNKYYLLRNAIDLEKFVYSRDFDLFYRKEFNLEDKYIIGHIGNFTYPKNHIFLLKIFNSISKMKDNAVLVLIGDGPEKEKIEKIISDFHLDGKVIMLGTRKDVNKLLSVFDCFVFPSIYEGLPVVLIEAQASRLSCFVSSSITNEVSVSNSIYFLDLNDNPDYWASKIIDNSKEKSLNSLNLNHGYDVGVESKLLEKYYYRLLNRTC
jgi:glycosyltransferase involved in cell wall biosynthesis